MRAFAPYLPFAAGASLLVAAACSAVPDPTFEIDDAGGGGTGSSSGVDVPGTSSSGGSSSGASASGAVPSSSSGGSSSSSGGPGPGPSPESPLCRERKNDKDVGCCNDTPCWGAQCPASCGWCESQCNAPDKRCCLPQSGEKICINLDEDCEEKLD
jgi:hypothetical protein